MHHIHYNKLVRDSIPEIVANTGKKANTRILMEEEFLAELKKKLQEEVKEFLESGSLEELADILEVVDALATGKGESLNKVLEIKKRKKAERGGFDGRVFLQSVEDVCTQPSDAQISFIGIDVHLSRFTAALLDENLQVVFVSDFTLDELIEKINEVSPLVTAVDAPLGLNSGLMDDERYRKKLGLLSDKHHNKKVSEYELARRGIFLYPSPKTMDEISGWKSWMGTGFQLYERLKQLGYSTVNPKEPGERIMAEVFPHASFTTLAGRLPANKSTDAGLRERTQILEAVGIKGFREDLKGSRHTIGDKLDAIAAAYTAYTIWNGQASFVGDPDEGLIALPVGAIRDKYKKSGD